MKLLLLLISGLSCISSRYVIDTWEQRADFGNFGRHRATGVGLNNHGYAGMGHQNGNGVDIWFSDWWEYDPSTNSWTQKTDYPGNNGWGDQDVVALALGDCIYAGLGQLDGDAFYKYDPTVNQWTVASPPPGNTFSNTAPFSIGGKGYFPALFSNQFFCYEAATNLWSQMANLPFNTIFGNPTFAVGGKGYIKDGANFYCYDPVSNSWSQKANFPGAYPNRPIGVAQSNFGFFIGGFQGDPMVQPWEWSPEVWRYNPADDSWLRMPDFPGTTRRWAVVMNVNDHVYYGLGTNGTNFNDFWEFSSTAGYTQINAENFIIAPNPAEEYLDIRARDQHEFELEILNSQGQFVHHLSSQFGKIRIPRGTLPAGVYFGIVQQGDHIFEPRRFVFVD